MRVNLCLQKFIFHRPQVRLLPLDILHKLADLFRHIIEAVCKNRNLILRFHLHPGVKITFRHLSGHITQLLNRPCHTSESKNHEKNGQHNNQADHNNTDSLRTGTILQKFFFDVGEVGRFCNYIFLNSTVDYLRKLIDIVFQHFHIFRIFSAVFFQILINLPDPFLQGIQSPLNTHGASSVGIDRSNIRHLITSLSQLINIGVRIHNFNPVDRDLAFLQLTDRLPPDNRQIHTVIQPLLKLRFITVRVGNAVGNLIKRMIRHIQHIHQIQHQNRQRQQCGHSNHAKPLIQRKVLFK